MRKRTSAGSQSAPSRRSFLKTASSVAAAAPLAGAALGAPLRQGVHHGGTGELKVGLIGCGGRGTGAAAQALKADPQTVLWAAGDAFADRLQTSLEGLGETEVHDRVLVPPERRFVGFDAYRQVLASGVDVVVLATPPHFRPQQIEAAVEAGVHVFAEKPVAVDAPGVRRVMAACERARQKGLSVVSGLCYRYEDGRRELVQRLHDGQIGEILAIQGNYITGELWHWQRQDDWTDMEYQLRNWLYYTWLSGDHIVEQHIHTLDVMAWIMGDYPQKAVSLGGRQVRTDPKFGNIYDHFATIYVWDGDRRGFSYCRQQNGCHRETNEYVIGSEGKADVFARRITGKRPWRFEGKARYMYQAEHDELFAAIRKGEPIHNGDYMCKSTLMAILGRMAAYTGKEITWDEAWNSQEDLSPAAYEWGPLPVRPVAMPGITKFA